MAGVLDFLKPILLILLLASSDGSIFASGNQNFTGHDDDDFTRLLTAVRSTECLADSSGSHSRTNLDLQFEQALLKLGRFDEAIERINPLSVSLKDLNLCGFWMARKGMSEKRVSDRLVQFRGQGRLKDVENFADQLRPGVASGLLLHQIETAKTQQAIILAEEVLDYLVSAESGDRHRFKSNLFEVLILASLQHDHVDQAVTLFKSCDDLSRKKLLHLGYRVVDHYKYKSDIATIVLWLQRISSDYPEFAVDYAGRLIGKFRVSRTSSVLPSYLSARKIDLFRFIRDVEQRNGDLLEIQARLTQLEEPLFDPAEKNVIEKELLDYCRLRSTKDREIWIAYVKILTYSGEAQELIALSEKTNVDYPMREFDVLLLAKALADLGKSKQALELLEQVVNDLEHRNQWYQFGLIAVAIANFDLANMAVEKLSQLEVNRHSGQQMLEHKLKLIFLAAQSQYSQVDEVINFLIDFAKRSENGKKTAQLGVLGRFLASEEFLGKLTEIGGATIAEQFISQVPDSYFQLFSRPDRAELRRSVVSKLIEIGKADEAIGYAKKCHDTHANVKIFTPLVLEQLIGLSELDELFAGNVKYRVLVRQMITASARREQWKTAKGHFKKYIQLLQTNKSVDFIYVSKLETQPEWIAEFQDDIVNIKDQRVLKRFFQSCFEAHGDRLPVKLIVELASQVESDRARCQLFLVAIDSSLPNALNGRFQFPMQLPN